MAPPYPEPSNTLDILNLTRESICRFIYTRVDGVPAIVFLPRAGSVYNVMASAQLIWGAKRVDEKSILCVVYLDGNGKPSILHNVAREGNRVVDFFYKNKNGIWTDSFRKYDEKIKSLRGALGPASTTTYGSIGEASKRTSGSTKFTLNVANIERNDACDHAVTKIYKVNAHLFTPKSGYTCNKVVYAAKTLWTAKGDDERCILALAIEKRKKPSAELRRIFQFEDFTYDSRSSDGSRPARSYLKIPHVYLDNISSIYLLIRTSSCIPKHKYFKRKSKRWLEISFGDDSPRFSRLGEKQGWRSNPVTVSTLEETQYSEDFFFPRMDNEGDNVEDVEDDVEDVEDNDGMNDHHYGHHNDHSMDHSPGDKMGVSIAQGMEVPITQGIVLPAGNPVDKENAVPIDENVEFMQVDQDAPGLEEGEIVSQESEENNESNVVDETGGAFSPGIFDREFDSGSDASLLPPVDHRNIRYEEGTDRSVAWMTLYGYDNPCYETSPNQTGNAVAAPCACTPGRTNPGCNHGGRHIESSSGSTEYANTCTVDLLNVDETRVRLYRDSLYTAVTPLNDIMITRIKYGTKGLWKQWDDEVCSAIELRSIDGVVHIKITLETIYGTNYWHFYLQDNIWSRRVVEYDGM